MDKESMDRAKSAARDAGAESYRVASVVRQASLDWARENFPNVSEDERQELAESFEDGVYGVKK